MILPTIPIDELSVHPHRLWNDQWLLLTAGDLDAGDFNLMTVAWGSLGTMWNRPFAQVVVRPTRHTYAFCERHDSFTLCAFPEEQRPALSLVGTRSGRDIDKVAQSGLTPIASELVAAPGYAEAELILECRKIYWQDMEPAHFLDPELENRYPQRDYHRIYFGEIVAARGSAAYRG